VEEGKEWRGEANKNPLNRMEKGVKDDLQQQRLLMLQKKKEERKCARKWNREGGGIETSRARTLNNLGGGGREFAGGHVFPRKTERQ